MPSKGFLAAIAAIVSIFALGFLFQWIAGLFPNQGELVILGRRGPVRVVKDVQIKEVVKWRERTIECVDLVELVPRGTEDQVAVDDGTSSSIRPIDPSGRREERAVERFVERFHGQVDLASQAVLATLDVPPGGRYGWAIAATIQREAPPDGEARKVSLTAAENTPPRFSLGRTSSWFIGAGPVVDEDGARLVLSGLAGREAFNTSGWSWSAVAHGQFGQEKQDRRVSVMFGVGRERHRR